MRVSLCGPTGNSLADSISKVWDCKPERKEDAIHWVELKTSAEIRNERDMYKYERKLLKFWAQSFLLGVPTIIVGFRDQQGIVHRLEELDTASIPGKVKKLGKGTWDGNVCINFAAAFLECMSCLFPYLCKTDTLLQGSSKPFNRTALGGYGNKRSLQSSRSSRSRIQGTEISFRLLSETGDQLCDFSYQVYLIGIFVTLTDPWPPQRNISSNS